MASDREHLRLTFSEDAYLYDRARPHYPAAVFDAIEERVTGPQVLEIACGTGQATVPLAQRGFQITAVELGASMAEVARTNLAEYNSVKVITADFDQWPAPSQSFDLVVCATAFHWLNPANRLDRIAATLRPGGLLAVIDTAHVSGPSDAFFVAAQRCYERWDPSTPPNLRLQSINELSSPGTHEIDDSERFESVELQRFPVDHTYTADEYLDLLATFSNHRSMSPENLNGLLGCIRKLIDEEPNGIITKSHAFELRTALRR